MLKRETITEREYDCDMERRRDFWCGMAIVSGVAGVACAVFPKLGATVVEILQLVLWNLT